MPSIPVNHLGKSLYYVDTGAPPQLGSDKAYTTLIIVHGTAFHGATFRKILPLSAEHNLRLVIVNRRDYPGSSPYSNEELGRIEGGDKEAHEEFAKDRAREFASFIRKFVEENDIPRTGQDGKSGGVALMAWSSGNYYILPILAFADAIDSETRAAIEPYFRSLIIFDSPQWVIGSTKPEYGNSILRNTSLTSEERSHMFNSYVSGYYSHKSVTSRNLDDLQQTLDPEARLSSIPLMSSEELEELTAHDAAARSELAVRSAKPEVYMSFARRALFERGLLEYFPECGVDVVWCENTTWEAVYTTWTLEKLVDGADERKIEHRRFRTFMIPGPGANHFVHWDDPEKAMDHFTRVVFS